MTLHRSLSAPQARPATRRERCLAALDRALAELPFREDVEQGTQACRDWIAVREQLRRAKARLITMERAP